MRAAPDQRKEKGLDHAHRVPQSPPPFSPCVLVLCPAGYTFQATYNGVVFPVRVVSAKNVLIVRVRCPLSLAQDIFWSTTILWFELIHAHVR